MGLIKIYGRQATVTDVQSKSGYLRRQKWTAPLLGTTTKIHAAVTGTSSLITVTTALTQPDFPRALSVVTVGTDVANIVISGTNIRGAAITETIATPGSSTTTNGTKAFATVTGFTIAAGITSGTTVSIGTTSLLGLDRLMEADEYINGSVDGTVEATRATIHTSATDISLNTVSFNTALNGTKVFRAVYVTKELTTDSHSTT